MLMYISCSMPPMLLVLFYSRLLEKQHVDTHTHLPYKDRLSFRTWLESWGALHPSGQVLGISMGTSISTLSGMNKSGIERKKDEKRTFGLEPIGFHPFGSFWVQAWIFPVWYLGCLSCRFHWWKSWSSGPRYMKLGAATIDWIDDDWRKASSNSRKHPDDLHKSICA